MRRLAMPSALSARFIWLSVVLALAFAACRAPTAPGGAAPGSAAGGASGAPAASAPSGAATGAQSGGPAPTEIVIGTALPLTGQESRPCGNVKTAYEMATEEINAAGGIPVAEYNRKLPV